MKKKKAGVEGGNGKEKKKVRKEKRREFEDTAQGLNILKTMV